MGMISNLSNMFKMGSSPFSINTDYLDNMAIDPDLQKSARVQESKSIIEDPLSLVHSLGYKEKPYSLTYDTLKQMATKNSVVAAIIGTRINQVSSFSQPSRFTKDGVGYEITLRDPKKQPTKEQQKTILALEAFLENCGFAYDPHRDNFDAFLRKIARDSLTFDQLTFEVVPDRLGRPAEIYATDASTIRAAVIEPQEGEDYITHTDTSTSGNNIKWVQVYRGVVVAEFTGEELAFGIRNPRTDINIQPYGFSELEVLIHQITAHLWAEEYNSRYFSQGGTTKGILNLKGQNISKEQLDAFRRQWTAQIAGVTGAWKTPVVSVDGLEYINVSQSNREMEYEMWMNYLINIVSSVYQIDPAEINFPNRGGSGGGSGGGLGESGIENRIQNSKDKGLRPLLRFLESTINRYVIRRFSSEYSFNFVGLDKESETEMMAVKDKEVRTIKTINEVRKERGLDPLENGDIILDATFVNYVMQLKQEEAMKAQEQAMGGDTQEQPSDPNETPEVVWDGAGEGDNEEVQESQQQDAIDRSIDEVYSE